jgi:hypothetical protein
LDVRTAKTDILPAKVIGYDEKYVWTRIGVKGGCREEKRTRGGKKAVFH